MKILRFDGLSKEDRFVFKVARYRPPEGGTDSTSSKSEITPSLVRNSIYPFFCLTTTFQRSIQNLEPRCCTKIDLFDIRVLAPFQGFPPSLEREAPKRARGFSSSLSLPKKKKKKKGDALTQRREREGGLSGRK